MLLNYHADTFNISNNEFSIYNNRDFSNVTHPPLIGFSYDGIALYGKYDLSDLLVMMLI